MGKVYSLLVGINEYPPNVGSLQGCVNDVEAFEDYLKEEVRSDLALEVLTNSDATRENVVGKLRSHLSQAGKDDVALFIYCGHGARWASAPEFRPFFPETMDEGLVCFDSREPGKYDLADKELAVLLDEIAKNEPHLAVVFDCCHSGSGTRSVIEETVRRARQTHTIKDPRPLESYLNRHYSKLLKAGEDLFLPTSRHLLMAACERFQKSYEDYDDNDDPRGIFSSVLVGLLQGSGRDLSYQELFNRCRREVSRRDSRMLPQFESFGGFDSTVAFLGLPATRAPKQYAVHQEGEVWKLDAGSLQGIPTEPDAKVELALYPQPPRQPERVGIATVRGVGPMTSTLDVELESWEVDTKFVAEVTTMPLPGLRVLASGEAEGLAALKAASADYPHIEITTEQAGELYEMRSLGDRLEFWDRVADRRVQWVRGVDEAAAKRLLKKPVSHVATWERAVALQNRDTRLPTDSIDFWLTHGDHGEVSTLDETEESAFPEPDRITIEIPPNKKVRYKLWARNGSDQELHFALFYFSPEYEIDSSADVNVSIPPGEDHCMHSGPMSLVPDVPVENLTMKLLVSTKRFDEVTMKLEKLAIDSELGTPRGDDSFGQEKKIHTEDWFAKSIEIKLVHEGAVAEGRDVTLANGAVTVRAHSSVTARASMTAAERGSRAAGLGAAFADLLSGLGPEAESFELVDLGGSRSRGAGAANVLELNDITNEEALAEEPLEIVVDTPLGEGEHLLPLVSDGRHILIVGAPSAMDDGKTLVRVHHLHDIPSDRRSLKKALKLYFVKTVTAPFGREGGVNKLCWVEYAPDGTATRNEEGVAEQVEGAQRVLLVLHGIIGDSKGAAEGARRAGVDARFDTVLTYDYENLSTPIEETAADLAARLAEVGFGVDDGKELTILAHSMGGLVSRVFVERRGGDSVVDHLVMCGTPNGGSPFGKLDAARRLATTMTTLLLNYAPASAPFATPLLFLLNGSKEITPTLEQMKPGSPLLTLLNTAPPEVATRYSVLAGNVADYEAKTDRWFPKLLEKAAQGKPLEVLFGTPDHDIAASVESVLSARPIGEGSGTVPCLHTNYFSAAGGLAALKAVRWG